ncbi:DUF4350 domain-containing protein [Psychroflexus montanilacus]|uniref:DUF4350 domain-containing protein n=1 Tax=Psychroflexus montanilacus TaxID=2873598 RepID=UPI001CCA75F2|nr:DUF4350 domain-containing protein [Psychroflexus montanilacus]MBZ9650650.1 DUF4350 domain-containing protein [Psychroflexus montanilacus]
MDKKMKALLWGVMGLVILIILLDATKVEPTDWTASYVHTDKRALATEVFYEGLKTVTSEIEHIDQSPFEQFQDSLQKSGTYFFINRYVSLTDEESNELLSWAENGNSVFIASEGIPKLLLDTLGLDISFYVSNSEIEYNPSFNLKDKPQRLSEFKKSKKAFEYLYFSKIDSASTKALGVVKAKNEENETHTNYIQVNWGKGKFLLHLAPQVYTNYFMVDEDNADYTSRTLGYLNLSQPLFWDNYYKSGKERISNPLYYLLSNPYLKSAYYLIIITSLLYVLFGGKRKQRPIPIIPPVQNRSYEFAQTIAGMYLDKKDHKAIAQKQITSYLEQIRSTYNLSTSEINTSFLKDLASKTNQEYEDLKALFQYIERINTSEVVSEDELKTLDKKMTTFNS